MGETKKLVKKEITEAMYEHILLGLNDEISTLTSDQKKELREYVKSLSEKTTNHGYSNIFIGRKITDLKNGN